VPINSHKDGLDTKEINLFFLLYNKTVMLNGLDVVKGDYCC